LKSEAKVPATGFEQTALNTASDGPKVPGLINVTSYRTKIHDSTDSNMKTRHERGITRGRTVVKEYFTRIDDSSRHSDPRSLANNSAATKNFERSIFEAPKIARLPNSKTAGNGFWARDPARIGSIDKVGQQSGKVLEKSDFLNDLDGESATSFSEDTDDQSSSGEDTPLWLPHNQRGFRAFKTRDASGGRDQGQRSRIRSNELYGVENISELFRTVRKSYYSPVVCTTCQW
jgi:hypothetical protein